MQMLTTEIESRLSNFIAWGTLGVAILVTDKVSLEPVNLGKMVLTSTLAGACLGLVILYSKNLIKSSKVLCSAVGLFIFVSLVSIVNSANPWEKGFYGAYGRNTGFLTYLSFSILFLTSSLLRDRRSFRNIIKALFVAGLLNIIYGLFVLSGTDFINWNNRYNRLLGTFGNPDFISAFFGIFFTVCFIYLVSRVTNFVQKCFLFVLMVLTLFMILKTGALQGVLVSVGGGALVVYFYLRDRISNINISRSYLALLFFGTLIATAGIFQKGPLQSLLYKPSVSLRGEYWRAGLNMASDNLIFGIGLDSYGTFYRRFRDSSAAINPGVNTTTDAAHNVFIDIFAGTGILGLMIYSFLIVMVMVKALKIFKNSRKFDPVFIALFLGWLLYTIQSVISINQIGLGIWGWVLGGSIIGYEQLSLNGLREEVAEKKISKAKQRLKSEPLRLPASVLLATIALSVIFCAVATPPFLADAQLRQALNSKSFEKILNNAEQWPKESYRTNYVLVKLASGGFDERLFKLAYDATLRFSQDYPSWYAWYQINASNPEVASRITAKLHELDPFNPEFAPK